MLYIAAFASGLFVGVFIVKVAMPFLFNLICEMDDDEARVAGNLLHK